jgi:DNA-binding response OmpR family regulator
VGRRIVVVDDHAGLLEAITDMLEHQGWAVTAFTTVDEAHPYIRAHLPDVVLTDLNVGIYSGAALAKELRTDPTTAGIAVVAMSGTAEFTPGMTRLFDVMLRKPIELTALDALLRRALVERAR